MSTSNLTSQITFEQQTVLLENDPHPHVITDSDRQIFAFVNQKACLFFKMKREDLMAANFSELTPEMVLGQKYTTISAKMIERVHRGEAQVFNWIALDSEGNELPCEVRLVKYPSNERNLISATIIDLSDKRRTESALQDSEGRLNLALKASKLGTFDWFPMKNKLTWDERMHEIFGLDTSSPIDRNEHFFQALHPEDKERVINKFQLLMAPGFDHYSFENEYRIIVRDELRHIHTRGYLLRDEAGQALRSIGTCQDVTDRVSQAQELRDSATRLALIYNNTTNLMSLIRVENGHFLLESVNKIFEQTSESLGAKINKDDLHDMNLGYYLNALIGFDRASVEQRINSLRQVVSTKKEKRCLDKTEGKGAPLYLQNTFTPIIANGKVSHILWVAHDVTESRRDRKKLETTLKEVQRLKSHLERENSYLREELKSEKGFEEIVFRSEVFKQTLQLVERVAPLDATVLISGETGTGKELIARSIHNLSPRADKPMVKVNCGAIPDRLVESELFGYEKGAFTGADKAKAGKFELADNGTIFLDEIAEMPLEAQVKLLRVLQEGEVQRIGSNETKKIDVRVIAATNKELSKEIADGNFRQDLFFRINVFPIVVPPLRDRLIEIPLLLDYFIDKFGRKHNKQIDFVSDNAVNSLMDYSWPGNVRELENVVERAMILSQDNMLRFSSIKEDEPVSRTSFGESLNSVMRAHIISTLKACDWKVESENGAAAKLDLKPSTLRDKMKKLKIKRPAPAHG